MISYLHHLSWCCRTSGFSCAWKHVSESCDVVHYFWRIDILCPWPMTAGPPRATRRCMPPASFNMRNMRDPHARIRRWKLTYNIYLLDTDFFFFQHSQPYTLKLHYQGLQAKFQNTHKRLLTSSIHYAHQKQTRPPDLTRRKEQNLYRRTHSNLQTPLAKIQVPP